MSELPLKATLKAGGGYDAPWLTVDANDPDELAFKLKALVEHESALTLVVEAANALKAHNNAAPIEQGQTAPAQQEPPKQQGWGQSSQRSSQQSDVTYHPEGLSCSACGSKVIHKTVNAKSGKTFKFWSCPNQKNRDDGHFSQFAD